MEQEKRVICYFLRVYDPELLQLYEVGDFTYPFAGVLFQIIKNYSEKYNKCPTLEVVVAELQKVKQLRPFHTLEVTFISQILNEAFFGNVWRDDERKYWRDYVFEFLRARRVERALRKAPELIGSGEFDRLLSEVRQVFRLEKGRVELVDWVNSVYDRHRRIKEVWEARKIPTPFKGLNVLLRGGISPGELGVLAAVPKIGKSFLLVLLGDEAARKGFNVLHVTLEMSGHEVFARYDARASEGLYTLDDIQFGEFDPKVVRTQVSQRKGSLVVADVSTRRCTVSVLEALHERACGLYDKKFDLLLLDYANLVKPEGATDLYQSRDEVFANLHSFAKEADIAIWTIARLNRKALNAAIMKREYIGESYAILYNCDVLLSVEEEKKDKVEARTEGDDSTIARKIWETRTQQKEEEDEESPAERRLLMRCLYVRSAPYRERVVKFLMNFKDVSFKVLEDYVTKLSSAKELARILEAERVDVQ